MHIPERGQRTRKRRIRACVFWHVGGEDKCYTDDIPKFTFKKLVPDRKTMKEYMKGIRDYYSQYTYDSMHQRPSQTVLKQLSVNGWGVFKGFLPLHIISSLQDQLKTVLDKTRSEWQKMSGGGQMYAHQVLTEKTLDKVWFEFRNLVHRVLSPLLVSLGWVKVKEGYEYRCTGGSYLIYLGDCRPQTWHLDSNDPRTISIIIPLTEDCRMPEFAAPKHQLGKLISKFCKKFKLKAFPSIQETLATPTMRDWWAKHILVAEFRGQKYEVHVKSFEQLRPGDIIVFHPWVVHRGPLHAAGDHPKGCLFLQLQYTKHKYGRFSGNCQVYPGPSTVGMVRSNFYELADCIDNTGDADKILFSMSWYYQEKQVMDFGETQLMRKYIRFLKCWGKKPLVKYCPNIFQFYKKYGNYLDIWCGPWPDEYTQRSFMFSQMKQPPPVKKVRSRKESSRKVRKQKSRNRKNISRKRKRLN
jgi:hypothetical protein